MGKVYGGGMRKEEEEGGGQEEGEGEGEGEERRRGAYIQNASSLMVSKTELEGAAVLDAPVPIAVHDSRHLALGSLHVNLGPGVRVPFVAVAGAWVARELHFTLASQVCYGTEVTL